MFALASNASEAFAFRQVTLEPDQGASCLFTFLFSLTGQELVNLEQSDPDPHPFLFYTPSRDANDSCFYVRAEINGRHQSEQNESGFFVEKDLYAIYATILHLSRLGHRLDVIVAGEGQLEGTELSVDTTRQDKGTDFKQAALNFYRSAFEAAKHPDFSDTDSHRRVRLVINSGPDVRPV